MRLMRYSLFLLIGAILLGGELSSELISKLKREQIELQKRKIEKESTREKFLWISPITGSYTKMWSDQYNRDSISTSYAVSIDQPIFKTGGIYFGIKYAEANRRYSHLTLIAQERALIEEAASLLYRIHSTEYELKKQKLLFENAKIDLERKREAYLAGDLDSGFLDNALIGKNQQAILLYERSKTLKALISKFRSISDADHEKIALPYLTFVEESTFLKNNLDIQTSSASVNLNDYSKKILIAKHFPTFSLIGSYNYSKSENVEFGPSGESHYRRYGVKATVPIFDFTTLNSIESAQLSYLKAQSEVVDIERSAKLQFATTKENLLTIEKKIELTNEDKALYEKILSDTKELYDAGEKTEYDVSTLSNSVKIKEHELKILELDMQLELLTLYGKMASEF